jgi:hypothetical protein
MPNWCENVLYLEHDDPNEIVRLMELFDSGNGGGFFEHVLPCPKKLRDDEAVSYADEEKQRERRLVEKDNLDKFGSKDWYDWCIKNWGTKWDACSVEANMPWDSHFLQVVFETAWSPPTGIYQTLHDRGFVVEAYYVEYGCDFCGKWKNGFDETFSVSDNNFPSEIDEALSIRATIAEWERENEDDDRDTGVFETTQADVNQRDDTQPTC